jgi:hypothetical protein
MKTLLAWFKQPTSVAGIATFFGTFSAILLHQATWAQAAPLLAGAVVAIALPDNAGAKNDVQALTQALVNKLQVPNGSGKT